MMHKKLVVMTLLFFTVFPFFAQEKLANKVEISLWSPIIRVLTPDEELPLEIDIKYQRMVFEDIGVVLPFRIHPMNSFDLGLGCGVSWYPRGFLNGLFIRAYPLFDFCIVRLADEGLFIWNLALDLGFTFSFLRNFCFDISLCSEILDILGPVFIFRPHLDCTVGFRW